MNLTARVNGPPRLTGVGLIVLCSYRGGKNNAEPRAFKTPVLWRLFNLVTLLSMRRFIASMRDHFANPRDVDYQLAMADAIVAGSDFSDVTIIADASLAQSAQATPAGREVTSLQLNRDYLDGQRKTDTVVLVYPDALGLTWSGLERSATKIAPTVVIANGRRRMMTLDRQLARSLAIRRFLSNTRLVEIIWGVFIVPISAVLAAYDFARGRV